ncbi:hypothetical protein F4W67_17835 [Pseudomonas caricapapayae]|nr:hypothetical protein F4W67_17835 [Pseudomonas caricapapayae]
MKPLYGFCFYVPRRFCENGNKVPRRLYVAADKTEDGMPNRPAPVRGRGLLAKIRGLSDKMTRIHANNAGKTLFSASFSITAVPVSA